MTKRSGKTVFDKLLADHEIRRFEDGSSLVLIDRMMLHERTGAVALNHLLADDRAIAAPESVFCTIDHIVDTSPGRVHGTRMPGGEAFVDTMRQRARTFGLTLFDVSDPRQGIVHVIAPELGIALPGLSLVCPDSHTCTLGGLGTFAWGIGTSDCEHALASRTLRVGPYKQMRVNLTGSPPDWLTAKDMIIHLIGRHSAAGAKGYMVEFAGPVVSGMEIEERLTLCNMAIEFGAFTGIVAPDDKTIAYVTGRPYAPTLDTQEQAEAHWSSLRSDDNSKFDREITLDTSHLSPIVTWGTSPEQAIPIDMPVPSENHDGVVNETHTRALAYMGLQPGVRLTDLPLNAAFIGSCTNSRLSDLRRAARILKGRKVADGVKAVCVPGSTQVRRAAEAEGLDDVFRDAGFSWGEAGCAMCFYAGGESFGEGARVISSTNRNFEGRQGPGVRTHIASPETVALSAVNGRISNPAELYRAAREAT